MTRTPHDRHRTSVFAVVLAIIVAVSACSGSSDDDAGDTTTTTGTGTNGGTGTTVTTTLAPTGDVEPPLELGGTTWVVEFYRMEGGSMTNTLGGDAIAFTFGDDGSISGFTGCNDYEGTYTVSGPYDPFEEGVPDDNDGQDITIALTTVTENPCEGEFDIEQDASLLRELSNAERWFISRGNLILRGVDAFIEANPAG